MDKHHKSPIHARIAHAKGYAMHCHENFVPGFWVHSHYFPILYSIQNMLAMDESITDSGSEVPETPAAVHCLAQG